MYVIITYCIILSIFTNFNAAITTRGVRHHWREPRPEYPRYYDREGDQYPDYGHVSFYDRKPFGVDDLYRESERFSQNYNQRFNRQNNWFTDSKNLDNQNTEAFFGRDPNFQNQRQNTGSFQDINGNRGTRQIVPGPAPQLPWEDALRHSVYLTLIRDKIDNILANNRGANAQKIEQDGKDVYESTDVDLWRNIKKAPFKSNGKEKGPVFGDIAILSRGKLIEGNGGFEFVEDDNFKECIECHLYSSRPNEDEAEKILMRRCTHPNCRNQIIRALWTVRRIRHRNTEGQEPKFMYELMFSVASPKPDNNALDYNSPSQTFTIDENDKDFKNKIKENSKKVVFVDNRSNEEFKVSDHNNRRGKEQNIFNLNPDEIYKNSKEITIDPRIMNEGEDHQLKKFGNNVPVITHLHHHYYLNDKGIPMLKPSIKYDTYNNREVFIPSMFAEDVTEMDPRTVIHNEEEIQSTTGYGNYDKSESAVTNFQTTNDPVTKNPFTKLSKSSSITPSFVKPKKKFLRPTKQFIPSPKDEKIRYSEPDPLYITSTISPNNKLKNSEPENFEDTPIILKPISYPYNDHEESDGDVDDTEIPVSTQTPNQYEDSIGDPNIGTTIQNIYISEGSTQYSVSDNKDDNKGNTQAEELHIVYPATAKHSTTSTELPQTTKNTHRIQRRPYKVTRRVKPKTFSELLKSQPHKTITVSNSTTVKSVDANDEKLPDLEQKIADVNKKFAANRTNTFESQRTSRTKYQRKYNNSWSNTRRRGKSSVHTATTTENPTTEHVHTENYFTEDSSTETALESNNHDTIQDNVEEESEKEISIDRMSTDLNSDENMDDEDLTYKQSSTTKPDELVTDETNTKPTELNEDFETASSVANEDFKTARLKSNDSFKSTSSKTNDDFKTTSSIIDDDLITAQEYSTEMTKQSSVAESNDEPIITPLTRKSFVTSISLKLGNKTRPYHPTVTEMPTYDENTTQETNLEENLTTIPEQYATNIENITVTNPPKFEGNVKNVTKLMVPDEDVVVARIVEHSSLHKLKIDTEK